MIAFTEKESKLSGSQPAAKVEIEYYTDPLCCWSWSFEPQWRRLRYEFGDLLEWKYCMAGMLSDWKNYNDPVNSVVRPAQMGPVWKEAKHISGMPFNQRIWIDSPPSSSYPACFAVKTAELQGREAGELYLRMTREAVMIEGKDISGREVLFNIAEKMDALYPGIFSYHTFHRDFYNKSALPSFQEDMNQAKLKNITRYPTLIVRSEKQRGFIMTGYRPYTDLLKALEPFLTGAPPKQAKSIEDYKSHWKDHLSQREAEEMAKPEAPHSGNQEGEEITNKN